MNDDKQQEEKINKMHRTKTSLKLWPTGLASTNGVPIAMTVRSHGPRNSSHFGSMTSLV